MGGQGLHLSERPRDGIAKEDQAVERDRLARPLPSLAPTKTPQLAAQDELVLASSQEVAIARQASTDWASDAGLRHGSYTSVSPPRGRGSRNSGLDGAADPVAPGPSPLVVLGLDQCAQDAERAASDLARLRRE